MPSLSRTAALRNSKALSQWHAAGRNFKINASYSGDMRSRAIAGGVTDRVLAVLDVLVTFYPVDELSGERGLIAFPSNTRLAAPARGMGRRDGTTALGSPRDAGMDGEEGQRQRESLRAPWKGRAGEVEEAFGFSLALLLARSAEVEAFAAQGLETRTATGHQEAPDRLPTRHCQAESPQRSARGGAGLGAYFAHVETNDGTTSEHALYRRTDIHGFLRSPHRG